MNFIAATIELKEHINDPIHGYGLEYMGADAVIPASNSTSETKLRLLCYNGKTAKLEAFGGWKEGTRALVTGELVFGDDQARPLDLIISTLETNVPQTTYCNQVILGNAYFKSDEIKDRKNKQVATPIGTTMDDSDTKVELFLEGHESLKPKLQKRIRKGRPLCVSGYLREYRGGDAETPYRAIVCTNFSTRKDGNGAKRNPQTTGTAAGYAEVDPTPDFV